MRTSKGGGGMASRTYSLITVWKCHAALPHAKCFRYALCILKLVYAVVLEVLRIYEQYISFMSCT